MLHKLSKEINLTVINFNNIILWYIGVRWLLKLGALIVKLLKKTEGTPMGWKFKMLQKLRARTPPHTTFYAPDDYAEIKEYLRLSRFKPSRFKIKLFHYFLFTKLNTYSLFVYCI